MKNKVLTIVAILLLLPNAMAWAHQPADGNLKHFTKKDATTAMDAFHSTFYNPDMKLYAISSDMKGRAAIWVQAIYWDMIMNAYKRTKAPKYRQLIEEVYQGGYEQYDKYNWDEHPDHFILQDADQPIDFGEGKKNIYALEGTEVLVQRNLEVQMAAHDFGKGRAVYISGVPYSFANSRTLYRAILWSAHSEEELHTWFSSNYNVEVHAYVKNGKYCVVNNTYEPQDTTVYTTDGNHFDLHLEANEIKWYEI